MWTVRYVGLFLEGLLAVPWPVVERLAVQLGIGDPSVVKRYTERRQALFDPAASQVRSAEVQGVSPSQRKGPPGSASEGL